MEQGRNKESHRKIVCAVCLQVDNSNIEAICAVPSHIPSICIDVICLAHHLSVNQSPKLRVKTHAASLIMQEQRAD